jgi:hypothetical protein
MGGLNNEENLVLLTAREHFIVHKLLTYIYPLNIKILTAFHCIIYRGIKKNIKITSRDYKYIQELRSFTPVSLETREKLSKSRIGTKLLMEVKELMRINREKKYIKKQSKQQNISYHKQHSKESRKIQAIKSQIKILQYDLNDNFIRVWDSAQIAGNALDIPNSNICKVLKNIRSNAGGFKWRYYSIPI